MEIKTLEDEGNFLKGKIKASVQLGNYNDIDLSSTDYTDDQGFCIWVTSAQEGNDIKVTTINDTDLTITVSTNDIPWLRGACRFKKVHKTGTTSDAGLEAWS